MRANLAVNPAIFNTVSDALIVFDGSGAIHVLNVAAESLFGYRAQAARRLTIDAILPGLRNIRGALIRELVARRSDGTMFPAEISVGMVSPSRWCCHEMDVRQARKTNLRPCGEDAQRSTHTAADHGLTSSGASREHA